MPVPPEPATPGTAHQCWQTNIVFIDTNLLLGTRLNQKVMTAGVEIVPKHCPKIWYFGIVNEERRQWCIHEHEAAAFEASQFDPGLTQLWRTKYFVEDLMVVKLKKPTPRQWIIPAQVSK